MTKARGRYEEPLSSHPASTRRGKIKHFVGPFIFPAPLSHDNKTREQTHTHTHLQKDPSTHALTQRPSAISHPAQAGKPIFEVHIDFLNQRATTWRHNINLYVWQPYGAKK